MARILGTISSGFTETTSFESIATASVGPSGDAYVEFTSIPSTYQHLQIRGFASTSRTFYGTDSYHLRFNSDTSTNYNYGYLRVDGGSPAVSGGVVSYHYDTGQSEIYIGSAAGTTTIATSGDGAFGVSVIDILDYKDTNKYKTIRTLSGVDINGVLNSYAGFVYLQSGLWKSTSAISSIRITGDTSFRQHTHFALYGIKGA